MQRLHCIWWQSSRLPHEVLVRRALSLVPACRPSSARGLAKQQRLVQVDDEHRTAASSSTQEGSARGDCPGRAGSAGGCAMSGHSGQGSISRPTRVSAVATLKAYISRTHPSRSLDSGSASMCAVSRSHSGTTWAEGRAARPSPQCTHHDC